MGKFLSKLLQLGRVFSGYGDIPSNDPVPSPLENLPAEIRRQILFLLDLYGIKSLASVSPKFYHLYVIERHVFLHDALKEILGIVAKEAYAVQMQLVQTLKPKPVTVKYPCHPDYGIHWSFQSAPGDTSFLDEHNAMGGARGTILL
jgi:hypothetical protein